MGQDQIRELILENLIKIYEQKERDISPEHLRHMEKILLLNTIDAKWKDHLYAMDQLRGAVGLRSYAQRDPLIEYKREGYEMFQMMYSSINQEVAEMIFRVQPVEGREGRSRRIFGSLPREFVHNEFAFIEATSLLYEKDRAA